VEDESVLCEHFKAMLIPYIKLVPVPGLMQYCTEHRQLFNIEKITNMMAC